MSRESVFCGRRLPETGTTATTTARPASRAVKTVGPFGYAGPLFMTSVHCAFRRAARTSSSVIPKIDFPDTVVPSANVRGYVTRRGWPPEVGNFRPEKTLVRQV